MRLAINSTISIFLLLTFLVGGCGFRSNPVEEYNNFGIKSAKLGLWDEAIMRWKRVTEMDPDNAKAHNNLGVGYEATGKLEEALAEYKMAVELEPGNKIYTKNYDKCKKNHERVNASDKTQETETEIQDEAQDMDT